MWLRYGLTKDLNSGKVHVVEDSDLVFRDEIPHLKLLVGDQLVYVKITGLLAIQMRQRYGKEMAMSESRATTIDHADGVVTLWIGSCFVGCGFRVRVDGKVVLVTANHVYEKLIANFSKARVGHKGQYASMPLSRVVLRAKGELDVVLLEDARWLYASMGVSVLASTHYKTGTCVTQGTGNGVEWMTAMGKSGKGKTCFRIKHKSTTHPGWSGSPLLDLGNRVMGVHTGSDFRDGEYYNEAVGFVDLMRALRKRTRRNESFEDFEKSEWSVVGQELELEREAEAYAEDIEWYEDRFRMGFYRDSYGWADYSDDEDEVEEIDHTDSDRAFESAKPFKGKGLASGSGLVDSLDLAASVVVERKPLCWESLIQQAKAAERKKESTRRRIRELTERFNKRIASPLPRLPFLDDCVIGLKGRLQHKFVVPHRSNPYVIGDNIVGVDRTSVQYKILDYVLKEAIALYNLGRSSRQKLDMLRKRVLESSSSLEGRVSSCRVGTPVFATKNPFEVLSQSLKDSAGQPVTEARFEDLSAGTALSPPKGPRNQVPWRLRQQWTRQPMRSASRRDSSYGKTMWEKITFMVTGQHRVDVWRPGQQAAFEMWERRSREFPQRFESAYLEALTEKRSRVQRRRYENSLMARNASWSAVGPMRTGLGQWPGL